MLYFIDNEPAYDGNNYEVAQPQPYPIINEPEPIPPYYPGTQGVGQPNLGMEMEENEQGWQGVQSNINQ